MCTLSTYNVNNIKFFQSYYFELLLLFLFLKKTLKKRNNRRHSIKLKKSTKNACLG